MSKETDVPTISIDMDKNCKRCGAAGVTESELCLECVAKITLPFKVPFEDEFSDSVFIEDIRLEQLGGDIVAEYDDFSEIAAAKILYLWKQKGGKSGGKVTLGKCQKPSGLLLHFASADFIIWLAADHALEHRLTEHQIKALMFHELKHCGYDPETGEYAVMGHDFEGFGREIEEFGLWKSDIMAIAQSVQKAQPSLFTEI